MVRSTFPTAAAAAALMTAMAVVVWFAPTALARNDDLFHYGRDTFEDDQGRRNFGQPDWSDVTCDDLETCSGFVENYPHAQFNINADENKCRSCPESRPDTCGLHHQSPIDLQRDRGELLPDGTHGENEKECPDWHYMQTRDDTCSFDDLKGNFEIDRFALQLNIPQTENGEIACEEGGQRMYPRLDYSKGFPHWWHMQRLDIVVPSNHVQEGIQYAAEVVLAHFYEVEHYKNQLGHVSIFLQDYPGVDSWAYLDKLICQWRLKEEEARSQCGQSPAEPYGRCELFRGQSPTAEWLAEEAGQLFGQTNSVPVVPPSTQAPFVNEPMAPVATPTTTPAPIVPTATTTTTPPPITLTVGTTVVKPGVVTVPVATPVVEPGAATGAPTESANGSTGGVPPEIQCNAFNVNYPRMCSSDKPCCSESRVDTTFCWESYEELGDAVESACFHCCETPMQVGPAAVPKPELPKTIACSGVDNAHRMCKSDGCCTNPRSETDYCQSLYDTFNDSEMSEVCHYCCSTSQEVGPSVRRNLRLPEKAQKATTANGTGSRIPEGAKVFNVYGRQFVLGPENFERDEEDEHAYFQRMYDDHKRRSLQVAHSVNYDDIEWVPYEWLMKVGTEYYYRYEGTMLVPPCWETVHWRTMKDPIQVHERQIAELNRLLAWRVNPDTCEVDTAGVLQEGGNTVRMDRELQYMHKQHRQVFCECKDWGSKFAGDVEWCDNWEEDVNFDRFYTRPYSFESGWLP